MSENSAIEWCDHTFNPWEGCQKIGPGCDHCYAETRNARFGGGVAINWGPGAPRRRTSPANWRKPLAWNKAHAEFFAAHGRRQRVFCASLADVFDNAVDRHWRQDLFDLILATPNLDWLLLTKRIGNAGRMLQDIAEQRGTLMDASDRYRPLPNVWIGATFCNQEEWDRDADKLFAVPAQVHFGSFEPLLSEIALLQCPECGGGGETCGHYFSETGSATCERCNGKGERKYLDLGWAIVGGESGAGARQMDPAWVRSLRDQCEAAGVPFLFKQWGEWAPNWLNDDAGNKIEGSEWADRMGKKLAGRLLDGVQHDGYPEAI